jgi:putative nucleotidyltransferase with HDIG domain
MASKESPVGSAAWARLSGLFAAWGACDYVGEPVSQAEHSLQCAKCAMDATKSRAAAPDREEEVLGALFHDIGHMLGLAAPSADPADRMGDCGVMHHERLGGAELRRLGLTPRVAKLVEQHVNAKRYLCGTNPNYYEKLSPASRTTLGYQGGPFDAEECRAFFGGPGLEGDFEATNVGRGGQGGGYESSAARELQRDAGAQL